VKIPVLDWNNSANGRNKWCAQGILRRAHGKIPSAHAIINTAHIKAAVAYGILVFNGGHMRLARVRFIKTFDAFIECRVKRPAVHVPLPIFLIFRIRG
jgi:hypothetical protein